MTQDKNTVLTPEEQAELLESMPKLLEGLKKGSPVASAWLAQWRGKRISEEAQEEAAEIREEIATTASQPEQASLMQWCGFPTDMTRCSPFFPMNPKELGQREFLRDFLITSANWGEIKYTGPKLSTYEEDALMVLLAILDSQSQYKQKVEEEGRKTYTYKGPVLPLFKLLGYAKPNKKDYQRLISALELLMSAVVKLEISGGKTKSGKRRVPRKIHMSNLLSGVLWDDNKKEFSATVNPFFYETYMAGNVTLIDVAQRIKIKGVIAKALYRFIQSHKKSPVFVGHFLTLADALNMDREQPQKETKRNIKIAVLELIKQGILTKKSKFLEDGERLLLDRSEKTLPQSLKNSKELLQ